MRRALLVVAVGLVALVATLLLQPNLVLGLRSPRVLAWGAGLGLVCLLVALVARRFGARPGVALSLAAIPAAAALALAVVEPLVTVTELDEALPTSAPVASPTRAPVPSRAATAATPATATPTTPTTTAPTTGPTAAPPSTPTMTAPTTSRLATGSLRGLDGHDASGRVSTYRTPDGGHVIRFESVDIGGTPTPHVYVLPGKDRTGKKGGVHLGELKAEKGSFNYALPASFVGTEFTVLVWCERFAVNIAHATQV